MRALYACMKNKLQKIKWTFIYLFSFAFISVGTLLIFVQVHMHVMVIGFLFLLSISGPLVHIFLLPLTSTFEITSFVTIAVVSLLLWCYLFAHDKSPATDLWLPVLLWVGGGATGTYFILLGAG